MARNFQLRQFGAKRAEIGARVRVTPLVFSDELSASTGCSVYLKAESLQITHAFKIRAAYGALLPRLEEARKRGVVTGSIRQLRARAGVRPARVGPRSHHC